MTTLPVAAELYAKVRALRKVQRLSAEALAQRMTAQGFPIVRSQIANGETGRMQNMSVDFADHAARALGMTLVQLITEPAVCVTCEGKPPAGFTCNACGTGGA